jgi:hypothetical protein
MIELTIAQCDEHRLVLILHDLLDLDLVVRCREKFGVGCLGGLENAPTIREKMRDHMRVLHPRILGLNVIHASLVPDVGVVSQKRRLAFGHWNLAEATT